MAALYGRLKGNRGETTRMGSEKSGISSKLETWTGAVYTELEANGTFRVFVGSKYSRGAVPVFIGKVPK